MNMRQRTCLFNHHTGLKSSKRLTQRPSISSRSDRCSVPLSVCDRMGTSTGDDGYETTVLLAMVVLKNEGTRGRDSTKL